MTQSMTAADFVRKHVRKGKGRTVRRVQGEMNRTEAAYAAILEQRKAAGEVVYYRFDAIKFRLGELCFYSPDFVVMLADGAIELHEVKGGFIEDDAMVKAKVCAEEYPFPVVLCIFKNKKTGWKYRRFEP